MKLLSALVVMMFAISAFASSQTKSFFYDGTQDAVNMSLRAAKTHIEYRYEQRWTTCYRTVTHFETRCYGNPPRCQTVPVTRTVPYSCMETVSVPYEVWDYDVEADVTVKFAELATELPVGETIKVTLSGDHLYLSAVGSKKFFILAKEMGISSQMNGSLKLMDASYEVSLVEAAPVVKALEMTDISLKNSVLNFKIGPVEVPELIGFSLEVKKNPILGSSTVLFDRELQNSEIMIANGESSAAASVNIKNLGVELESGRYTLTAKTFFKHSGKLINKEQFERVEASRTLIYKIR